MSRSVLLSFDAVINLALGAFLVWYPRSIVDALGLPSADSAFYPNILGAVLFGVGIALLLERPRSDRRGNGLGLGGAIAINLCGGVILAAWLLAGDLSIPQRGYVPLWMLVGLLIVISASELASMRSRQRPSGPDRGG